MVALKTIPPAHLAGAHARERFRLEASTASRLDHPNIVPIFEVGERDGFCCYSMKLVEGGNLAARISLLKSQISNHDAARLIIKVAHAVYHAHQRGVLHRDLKPSNILLDLEDEPHVSDFGLARQIDEDSSLTLSQALIGTPAYLSPEVATFPGHSWADGGLALLPDGQTLISGAGDIHFWDVRTRQEIDTLDPRAGWLSSLALSSDGRRLATGTSDGRIIDMGRRIARGGGDARWAPGVGHATGLYARWRSFRFRKQRPVAILARAVLGGEREKPSRAAGHRGSSATGLRTFSLMQLMRFSTLTGLARNKAPPLFSPPVPASRVETVAVRKTIGVPLRCRSL